VYWLAFVYLGRIEEMLAISDAPNQWAVRASPMISLPSIGSYWRSWRQDRRNFNVGST
jgi:hypothetical protein